MGVERGKFGKKDSLSVVFCLPDKQGARIAGFLQTKGQVLHAHLENQMGAYMTRRRARDTGPIGESHVSCLMQLPMLAARSRCRSYLPVQLIFKEKIRSPVGNQSLLKDNTQKRRNRSHPLVMRGWRL